jgi:hypothetical protein
VWACATRRACGRMRRAARIAGSAGAGQVLCSSGTWRACEAVAGSAAGSTLSAARGGLIGVSLGKVELKGVSAPMELMQCARIRA